MRRRGHKLYFLVYNTCTFTAMHFLVYNTCTFTAMHFLVYNTCTFTAMRFNENPFTCRCKEEQKGLRVSNFERLPVIFK